MSFRGRIALAAAAAVAIAVVLASLLVYLLTANQLHSQVDNQLRSRAHETRRLERLFAVGALKIGPNGAASIVLSAPGAFAIAAKEAESDISTKLRAKPQGLEARRQRSRRARRISRRPGSLFGKLPPNPDQVRGYQQVVDSNGKVLARSAPDRDAAGRPPHRAARRTRRRTVLPQRDGRRRCTCACWPSPSAATEPSSSPCRWPKPTAC